MTEVIWAARALLPEGWAERVAVEIEKGVIKRTTSNVSARGQRVGCLLPAPVNLHSHAFQRGFAGRAERRGAKDDFWSWREVMYRFVDLLTPDDMGAIAEMAYVEMAEAGFASVCEFHYLHHQPGGQPYDDRGEMANRILAAAERTGIGMTLLPVLYQTGGCDGRALEGGQRRFGNDLTGFAHLMGRIERQPPDGVLGVAPHSLRAVTAEGLERVATILPKTPVHIHVAEQVAEVDEVLAARGARPVEWLLDNAPVDRRWCLIHATQMTEAETVGLAQSGAVAGLCPVTEANLGDGIFNGAAFRAAGGRFGVGTDSNVLISLTDELRVLEYGQRLRDRSRAVMADPGQSTGRALYDAILAGGAQAAGRKTGAIAAGHWADLVALDSASIEIGGAEGDEILDAWIFAARSPLVRDVWSAGRVMVQGGRHVARDAVEGAFRATMVRLRSRM